VGHNFLDHSLCAISDLVVTASYIACHESFKFIAEGELDFVTGVAQLFRNISFGCSLLVAFHVDRAAVDINGDGFDWLLLRSFLNTLLIGSQRPDHD
jgi:hypothetical protein